MFVQVPLWSWEARSTSRSVRRGCGLGITKAWCVCCRYRAAARAGVAARFCAERASVQTYMPWRSTVRATARSGVAGAFLGVDCQRAMDAAHLVRWWACTR